MTMNDKVCAATSRSHPSDQARAGLVAPRFDQGRISIGGAFMSATALCWSLIFVATVPPIFGQFWLMAAIHGAVWVWMTCRLVFPGANQ